MHAYICMRESYVRHKNVARAQNYVKWVELTKMNSKKHFCLVSSSLTKVYLKLTALFKLLLNINEDLYIICRAEIADKAFKVSLQLV